MAKKPAGSPAAAQTRTFALAVPITDDAGNEYAEITLAEPELRHRAKAQRSKATTQTEQVVNYFAALSGIPESALRKLKTRDAHRMKAWLDAVGTDGVVDEPASLHEASRTFELSAPLDDRGSVVSVTVREPDLDAAIAVERMPTPADQTAALIASLSGLTIPVVIRMKMRDVARIEGWLNFFLAAGADSEETGQQPETASL